MITNALLDILNNFLAWFISVRPAFNISLDTGATASALPAVAHVAGAAPSALDNITATVSQALVYDAIFPVHECLLDLTIIFFGFSAVTGAKWALKLCDWVADIIP